MLYEFKSTVGGFKYVEAPDIISAAELCDKSWPEEVFLSAKPYEDMRQAVPEPAVKKFTRLIVKGDSRVFDLESELNLAMKDGYLNTLKQFR